MLLPAPSAEKAAPQDVKRNGLVPRAETEVVIERRKQEEIDYADFCN